jgi:hypothetical protein
MMAGWHGESAGAPAATGGAHDWMAAATLAARRLGMRRDSPRGRHAADAELVPEGTVSWDSGFAGVE